MCKMASSRLHTARWVLWALAICLMLHFLVEDSALLSVWKAGQQPGIPGSDEMTHQDDLALPVSLPESTAGHTPVTDPAESNFHAQTALLPIPIPPRVA